MKRSALVVVLSCITGASAQASPAEVAQEVSRLLSATDGSTGTIEGLPASYRIETSGRFHDHATTVLNIKFVSPTLRVFVRPRSADDDLARRGQRAEVQLGDSQFDRQFVVEGAPSDLVRALFDEPLRQSLIASNKINLDVDGGWIAVSRDGHFDAPDDARKFFAVATLATRRLRDGLQPATPLSDADRNQELARLQSLRNQQQRGSVASAIPAMLAGFVVIGLLIWLARRRR
jgi:hypothetical protein